MDLLTLLKMFLFLGCVCYTFTILSFIKRHFPRITWKRIHVKRRIKRMGETQKTEIVAEMETQKLPLSERKIYEFSTP